jgi:Fe-S cluster biogenesis protein NfuA
MNLTEQVQSVLGRGILPSVIARGANLRVAAVQDGIAVLEVTGSPGAVFPLAARIEALIRGAVPEITAVRLVAPAPGLVAPAPGSAGAAPAGPADLAEAARRVLDAEINPAIAAHRGHVSLVSAGDGWVRVRLEGGCQGCSLAEVTLRQGIEPILRARLPGMTGLVDVTDHEAGTEPFFSAEKR